MSAFVMDKEEVDDFRQLIPPEFYEGAKRGQFFCIGGDFMEEPAGALVYEKTKGGNLLRSIYVKEDFRRLGIASDMMEVLGDDPVFFTYEATGDRAALEPFFDAMDIDTRRIDCPMCYLSLKDIEKNLEMFGVFDVEEKGTAFAELDLIQRKSVMQWMVQNLNERGEAYEWIHPDSTFLMEGKKVKACVLISEMEPGLLSVDLVYSEYKDFRKLMGLFAHIFINIQIDYPKNPNVRMIMTTDSGKKLYEKIFGNAGFTVPVITAV